MKTILGLSALAIIGLSLGAFNEPQIVTDIKNGDKQLECLFGDGWKEIPKEKFVGIDDVNGRYLFTNGSAKTCEVY